MRRSVLRVGCSGGYVWCPPSLYIYTGGHAEGPFTSLLHLQTFGGYSDLKSQQN